MCEIARKPGALRNGAPFADMPLPLLKLQSELRRRQRLTWDRMMADVLANVPIYGLDAVVIAVEQVLTSGLPSVEHLQNVLNRLKSAKKPVQVATGIKLQTEPVANTQRYDRLNAQEINHA